MVQLDLPCSLPYLWTVDRNGFRFSLALVTWALRVLETHLPVEPDALIDDEPNLRYITEDFYMCVERT